MKIIQFIRNLTIYCSKFRLNELLSWNILQTAAAITTTGSTFLVIFAPKPFFTNTFKSVICIGCHTATTVMAREGQTWRLIRPGRKVCESYECNMVLGKHGWNFLRTEKLHQPVRRVQFEVLKKFTSAYLHQIPIEIVSLRLPERELKIIHWYSRSHNWVLLLFFPVSSLQTSSFNTSDNQRP